MAFSSRGMASSSASSASSARGGALKDVSVASDLSDTISCLRWAPKAAGNYLAASSWDGKAHVFEVPGDGTARVVATVAAGGPLLTCDWAKDGSIIATAGADKKVHALQAASGQTMTFGEHDSPVRALRFVDVPSAPAPIIATGSWDKMVRYWDLRNTAKPIAALQCADRVFSMDSAGRLLVIATAGLHIQLVDLHTNPAAFARTTESNLKHQTRVVTAFPDGRGWGFGSIEGRAGISLVDEHNKGENFTFRCHREPAGKGETKVWAVNDVSFHTVYQTTFTTAGSDGTVNFWDRASHTRLKTLPSAGGAVTATDFSPDGKIFAYAVGYDWSMGYAKNSPNYPTKLMLHPVTDGEVKPKRK